MRRATSCTGDSTRGEASRLRLTTRRGRFSADRERIPKQAAAMGMATHHVGSAVPGPSSQSCRRCAISPCWTPVTLTASARRAVRHAVRIAAASSRATIRGVTTGVRLPPETPGSPTASLFAIIPGITPPLPQSTRHLCAPRPPDAAATLILSGSERPVNSIPSAAGPD